MRYASLVIFVFVADLCSPDYLSLHSGIQTRVRPRPLCHCDFSRFLSWFLEAVHSLYILSIL